MNGIKNVNSKKKEKGEIRELTRTEEIIHALTHGGGALASVVGLIILLIKSSNEPRALISSLIFGRALVALYSASCFYHTTCALFSPKEESGVREFAKKCDHSIIYLLILGTYAPACISAMGNTLGFVVFAVVCVACLVGVILNVIDVEKFRLVSLFLYIISGWAIVAIIYPYYKSVGILGVLFLLLGGIAYTVGIIFYKAQSIKYMHIVWHACVLLGSAMHYIMVYFYCI